MLWLGGWVGCAVDRAEIIVLVLLVFLVVVVVVGEYTPLLLLLLSVSLLVFLLCTLGGLVTEKRIIPAPPQPAPFLHHSHRD